MRGIDRLWSMNLRYFFFKGRLDWIKRIIRFNSKGIGRTKCFKKWTRQQLTECRANSDFLWLCSHDFAIHSTVFKIETNRNIAVYIFIIVTLAFWLNNERKKLANAREVTNFVKENSFLKNKWKQDTNLRMDELKPIHFNLIVSN